MCGLRYMPQSLNRKLHLAAYVLHLGCAVVAHSTFATLRVAYSSIQRTANEWLAKDKEELLRPEVK